MTAPTKARGQQIKPTIAEVNAAGHACALLPGKAMCTQTLCLSHSLSSDQ